MRWKVQVVGIQVLHLKPGGINSITPFTGLEDMFKRGLRVASNKLSLFQYNYPEMLARKVHFFLILILNIYVLCINELYRLWTKGCTPYYFLSSS